MKITRLIVGLVGAAALVLVLCSYLTKKRAGQFIVEIRHLDVGSNDSEAVLAIVQNFRSSLTNESGRCDLNTCSVEFSFQNPLLKLLKVERRSRLDAVLRVENHRVGYVYITFGTGGGAKPLVCCERNRIRRFCSWRISARYPTSESRWSFSNLCKIRQICIRFGKTKQLGSKPILSEPPVQVPRCL